MTSDVLYLLMQRIHKRSTLPTVMNSVGKRRLWYWVNFVFNKVDHSRVKAVGPDRAAAEWVLRLGGSVKFADFKHWSTDYNLLPSGSVSLRLEAINNNGIAVTSNGLEHLAGLKHLHSLSLSNCHYLHNEGISLVPLVKHSLTELDISHCSSLTSQCLQHLHKLEKLEHLNLSGMKVSKDQLDGLQQALPDCQIKI